MVIASSPPGAKAASASANGAPVSREERPANRAAVENAARNDVTAGERQRAQQAPVEADEARADPRADQRLRGDLHVRREPPRRKAGPMRNARDENRSVEQAIVGARPRQRFAQARPDHDKR
jgi:hypothetical protein